MSLKRFCLYCKKEIEGRSDKKYCDSYCKSTYFYQKKKESNKFSDYVKIDKQLKLNRRLLQYFNRGGMSTINEGKLLEEGFSFKYFTHYYKTQKGQVYLFCYDYGYLRLKDKKKVLLVEWQKYMERPLS